MRLSLQIIATIAGLIFIALGAIGLTLLPYWILYLTIPIATLILFFQIFINFPCAAYCIGWKRSLFEFKGYIILFCILLSYEAINLTGFSWRRLEFVSQKEMIDAAIKAHYGEIYSNEEELKADYSTFKPEVSFWKSWNPDYPNDFLSKWWGLPSYQVTLPDRVMIVSLDGKVINGRTPSYHTVAPDNAELGIIASFAYETPPFEINTFDIRWSHSTTSDTLISGHCFSTYIKNAKDKILHIGSMDAYPTEIKDQYGFYFETIKLRRKSDGPYSATGTSKRIPKAAFLKYKFCDKQIQDDWPNFVQITQPWNN